MTLSDGVLQMPKRVVKSDVGRWAIRVGIDLVAMIIAATIMLESMKSAIASNTKKNVEQDQSILEIAKAAKEFSVDISRQITDLRTTCADTNAKAARIEGFVEGLARHGPGASP